MYICRLIRIRWVLSSVMVDLWVYVTCSFPSFRWRIESMTSGPAGERASHCATAAQQVKCMRVIGRHKAHTVIGWNKIHTVIGWHKRYTVFGWRKTRTMIGLHKTHSVIGWHKTYTVIRMLFFKNTHSKWIQESYSHAEPALRETSSKDQRNVSVSDCDVIKNQLHCARVEPIRALSL